MNSLERAGLVLPAVCRAGECGACRTRLVSGKVFAPERVNLRYVDVKYGYIHPCASYPLEDLRIRLKMPVFPADGLEGGGGDARKA